jgi:hypothetical protein
MSMRFTILLLCTLALSSCGEIFMYAMGARGRAVPMRQFSSLYYKTSPDLKKAYVFYAIPGKIATGASTLDSPEAGYNPITIEFAAVKATEKNKREYGNGIDGDIQVNGEWVAEFGWSDQLGLDPKRPHDQQVKVFYGLDRRERGESIPYRGIWKSNAEHVVGGNRR